MSLREEVKEILGKYPGKLKEKRGNIFAIDLLVAKRKVMLNISRLTYSCRFKIDDDKNEIRFFEILKESGAGMSSGGYDEFGSGFGFKTEKTGLKGKERTGTIKQQTDLFGKKYEYEFDFGKIREEIKALADKSGYGFKIVLSERKIKR